VGELSQEADGHVVGTFLAAYNRHRGSEYALAEREPAEDLSCDYLCADPRRRGEQLKIQLTRPVVPVEMHLATDPVEVPLQAWAANRQPRDAGAVIRDSAALCALRTVMEKSARLGPSAADLVLVIFFDLKRYDADVDLAEMRSAVRSAARRAEERYGARFLEVWAAWCFKGEPGEAHLLWPIPAPEVVALTAPRHWEDSNQGVDDEGVVHALNLQTGDGLCGAYVVDSRFEGGPARCPECDALLRGAEELARDR